MSKIGYKVCAKICGRWSSCIISNFTTTNQHGIKYSIGKFISRSTLNGPLAVFDNLDSVRKFVDEHLLYKAEEGFVNEISHIYGIFECEYTESKETCLRIGTEALRLFTPDGTIFADSVKLTRKIEVFERRNEKKVVLDEGYKICRINKIRMLNENGFITTVDMISSYAEFHSVDYHFDKFTDRDYGCGPMALFGSLEDAERYLKTNHRPDNAEMQPFGVYECHYVKSAEKELYCRGGGRMINLPKGTICADSVRLKKLVGTTTWGILNKEGQIYETKWGFRPITKVE